jgi:hypothetical protein
VEFHSAYFIAQPDVGPPALSARPERGELRRVKRLSLLAVILSPHSLLAVILSPPRRTRNLLFPNSAFALFILSLSKGALPLPLHSASLAFRRLLISS